MLWAIIARHCHKRKPDTKPPRNLIPRALEGGGSSTSRFPESHLTVSEKPRVAHRKGIRLGFLLHDDGERLPIKIAKKNPSRGRKQEKREGRRS
jgi:hypothetical protein